MKNPLLISGALFFLAVFCAVILPAGTGWYSSPLVFLFSPVVLWTFGVSKKTVLFGFCCSVAGELLLGFRPGTIAVPFAVAALLIFAQGRLLQFRPLLPETGFPAGKIISLAAASVFLLAVLLFLSTTMERLVYGVSAVYGQLWFIAHPARFGFTAFFSALILIAAIFFLSTRSRSRYA